MTTALIHLLLAVTLGLVPPLSQPEQLQLDSARDTFHETDEGALYPLLHNAMAWPEHVEAGAVLPDYDAIQKDPASYRGQLFLIEGTLQRSELIPKLHQPGPWEGKLSEWAIQWGDSAEQMLIVDLVDPPRPVKDGVKVRLAARFYKLWPTTTKTGQTKTFMVFVGKDAKVLGNRPWMSSEGTGLAKSAILVAILAGICLFWLFRRVPKMSLEPKPTRRQIYRRKILEEQADQAVAKAKKALDGDSTEDVFEVAKKSVPKDPAQALQQLDQIDLTNPPSDTSKP